MTNSYFFSFIFLIHHKCVIHLVSANNIIGSSVLFLVRSNYPQIGVRCRHTQCANACVSALHACIKWHVNTPHDCGINAHPHTYAALCRRFCCCSMLAYYVDLGWLTTPLQIDRLLHRAIGTLLCVHSLDWNVACVCMLLCSACVSACVCMLGFEDLMKRETDGFQFVSACRRSSIFGALHSTYSRRRFWSRRMF